MKAIILAAGKGTRLNGAAIRPKCLIEVGGTSLLERQIASLEHEGISEIVVVVGFAAAEVRDHCKRGIAFVENENFSETSSLYSLWLAREHMANGFVVLNSDVLFHHQILRLLLSSARPNALLLDYRRGATDAMGEEEMKVIVKGQLVIDISKDIDPIRADGENVGIAKFSEDGASTLLVCLSDLVKKGQVKDWAPRAFLEFAREKPLYAISTAGYPWIEVDFPEDYQKALTEIYPQISSES